MKNTLKSLAALFLFFYACSPKSENILYKVKSPSGNNEISFLLTGDGTAAYLISHNDKVVIDTSQLGFDFKNQPSIKGGLQVVSTERDSLRDTWEMPWGEQRTVINHYNELIVHLKEKADPGRLMNLYFRAFDDGIGFRYQFPSQPNLDTLIIMDENTQFKLTGDHTCWWIPGDYDSYEHLYNTTLFSQIDALDSANQTHNLQDYIPQNAVNTPVTMRMADGTHLSFHEASLINYAGMTLKVDTANLMMTSELVDSDLEGYKAKETVPFETPWRTIQISDNAAGLIESKMILNLNEPNKLGDVSWVHPMKYVGIWWEMHIGKSTWDYASGKHGATTANAKRYIDFAAKNGIGGLLVEGWNTGWEHWIGFPEREGIFDFVTPYPDYDLKEVARYAKEKGVALIMHHETSAAPRTYEQQLDTAYSLMQSLDIHAAKTGYVGEIIPVGERHHGQWMVNHYQRVIEKAAKYHIAIDAHEPIKPTGLRRTYPNFISREGLRGQEFNAWSADGGNPPEHLSIVAFTRMLAGPIDFTPGVFNIKLKPWKDNNQINTTLAQQLALYVVIYSPIQMACDLPEYYEGQPGFQFIRDVGVDWDETHVLNGEVGDYVTIARKERGTGNWFVGGLTDENPRDMTISFSFLEDGKKFNATLYKDGEDADWDANPTSLAIEKMEVDKSTVLDIHLAAGGGFAISLMQSPR